MRRLALLVVALAAPGAFGAEEPPDEKVAIDETVVTGEADPATGYVARSASTAMKVETPILETPASIQVVPREVIDDQRVDRVRDAARNVSGVYAGAGGGDVGDQFFIRGFFVNEPFRNGFRARSFHNLSVGDLERIEILKGPAAMLYGRIEPGGLVNLVTKEPRAERRLSLAQEVGEYDRYRTSFDATGPVAGTSSLLYRLNVAYEDTGSFRDFVDRENLLVAPVIRWKPFDRTRLTFRFRYAESELPRDRGFPSLDGRPLDLPRSRFLGEPFNEDSSDIIEGGFEAAHDFTEAWGIRLRFTAEQTHTESVAVSNSALLEDGRTLLRDYFQDDQDIDIYQPVVELVGGVDTWGAVHSLVLGFDFYDQTFDSDFVFAEFPSIDVFEPVYGAPRPDLPTSPSRTASEWYGVYVQDSIAFGEHVRVLAGARYDDAESEFRFGPDPAIADGEDDWSPRVGLSLLPTPWLSIYGSYSESFAANDDFARSVAGEPLDPEIADQWEAGLKAEFLDRRLLATLAFFQLTKENIIGPDPDNPDFSLALGEARSRGVEVDLAGELTEAVSVIANYAYTDTEILESTSGNEGQRLFGAPRHGGSFWGRVRVPSGPVEGLTFAAGVVALGDREGDFFGPLPRLEPYERVDAMLAYDWMLGDFRVRTQLNVENLLDEDYFFSAQSAASVLPGTPRTVVGTLRVEL